MYLPHRYHSLPDPVAAGVVAAAAVVVIEDGAAAEAENFAAAVEAEVDVAGAEGDHVEAVPFVGGV